jgi:serine/threonine protein kinase
MPGGSGLPPLKTVPARSYPNGHANSAMLKALLKYLEASLGSRVADDWLRTLHSERRDFDDELRLIPLARVLLGLRAAVDVGGKKVIDRAAIYLLASDNLGAWARVVRGSSAPAEAFTRLDGTDTELSRTARWETLGGDDGVWRGRVHLLHDPQLEADGLLREGRMAELSVVPALFGLERGVVSSIEAVSDRGSTQDYEVRWSVPGVLRPTVSGACVGLLFGAAPFAFSPSVLSSSALLVGGVLGLGAGLASARDRKRRVETKAQRARISVLERSLLLRDCRELGHSGAIEGKVVGGQYRIVRRMGSGGSGVIYEALRTTDDVPVAIKLLRAVAAHDSTASDRLRREAEALTLSRHPNIVEVLDHGHLADGTSYVVMELLRGESLAALLERRRRLPADELVPIAAQVADALTAVHAAGVVHRDLKPSNIFLTPLSVSASGAPSMDIRAKIIDFGIARVEWEETRITNIGAPVGTPGYMSPEQEAGGEVDGRSDIYSFGAVLYECLTGEVPPSARQYGRGPPSARAPDDDAPGSRPNLSDSWARKGLSPAWRDIVQRAMSIERTERFDDARSLAQAIRALGPPSLGKLTIESAQPKTEDEPA